MASSSTDRLKNSNSSIPKWRRQSPVRSSWRRDRSSGQPGSSNHPQGSDHALPRQGRSSGRPHPQCQDNVSRRPQSQENVSWRQDRSSWRPQCPDQASWRQDDSQRRPQSSDHALRRQDRSSRRPQCQENISRRPQSQENASWRQDRESWRPQCPDNASWRQDGSPRRPKGLEHAPRIQKPYAWRPKCPDNASWRNPHNQDCHHILLQQNTDAEKGAVPWRDPDEPETVDKLVSHSKFLEAKRSKEKPVVMSSTESNDEEGHIGNGENVDNCEDTDKDGSDATDGNINDDDYISDENGLDYENDSKDVDDSSGNNVVNLENDGVDVVFNNDDCSKGKSHEDDSDNCNINDSLDINDGNYCDGDWNESTIIEIDSSDSENNKSENGSNANERDEDIVEQTDSGVGENNDSDYDSFSNRNKDERVSNETDSDEGEVKKRENQNEDETKSGETESAESGVGENDEIGIEHSTNNEADTIDYESGVGQDFPHTKDVEVNKAGGSDVCQKMNIDCDFILGKNDSSMEDNSVIQDAIDVMIKATAHLKNHRDLDLKTSLGECQAALENATKLLSRSEDEIEMLEERLALGRREEKKTREKEMRFEEEIEKCSAVILDQQHDLEEARSALVNLSVECEEKLGKVETERDDLERENVVLKVKIKLQEKNMQVLNENLAKSTRGKEYWQHLSRIARTDRENLQGEVDELTERMSEMMEQMERNTGEDDSCGICMEAKKNTVFDCGHVSCDSCANRMTHCHTCRRWIFNRRRLFLD